MKEVNKRLAVFLIAWLLLGVIGFFMDYDFAWGSTCYIIVLIAFISIWEIKYNKEEEKRGKEDE